MKNILLIFDMNGTVVDTEEAHWLAYKEVLQEYGIEFTLEEFSKEWTAQGKDLKDTLAKNGREDLLPQIKEIKAEKDAIFRAHLADRVAVMPGIPRLLNDTLKGSVRLALDSTSAREDIDRILGHCGIGRAFELVTSGDMEWDEEKYGKSAKGSRFRYISDTLGVPPDRCVVVGDAEKDVRAAKGEGMRVVSVPNRYTLGNDFSGTDRVIGGAGELTLELVEGLVSGKGNETSPRV